LEQIGFWSFFLWSIIDMSRKGEKVKSIIPYRKEISFGTKIAEITSMSLEHELDIQPGEARGNFIVSGDYRSHEVSVNREPFLYKLPFSIELTDRIDLDSIDFEILDFSYDILNDDTIEVDIEFSLEASELPEEVEILDEQSEEVEEKEEEVSTSRGVFEKIEDPVVEPDLTSLIDTPSKQTPEPVEETVEVSLEEPREEIKEEDHMMETNLKESEDTIIHNVNPMDDSYATYHIHIVNSGETVETICTMYHSNLNLLSDYNDMSNITVGDKIIIPKEDE